ncbi:MAG: gliding motility-associated C-terminal domain-containing protein [Saprospiraceae bacterium]|uniref:Gliding motility-associated C-terminal domain-containing protein n=1 Tax=Candidatus Defluviibacterium haderslevense TaxID=2981993 RepID=A0A9D7XCK9_9BACT|nr:gliding motility-associated C-terminal domain-containing protein [Candidatus Defluviibacterium haderslevense]
MKKLVLFSLCYLSVASSFAQLVFKFANANANKGDIVTVNVSVDNFLKVSATEYSMSYDSAVLEFVDLVNRHIDYVDANFGDHKTGPFVFKNGQIGCSWNRSSGDSLNLPNGTVLFGLRFKLIGKECDSSFVNLSNTPKTIDIIENDGKNIPTTSIAGKVKINGASCTSAPKTDVSLIASEECIPKNTVGCLKVSVRNFVKIESMQGTLKWDKTIARYSGIQALNLQGLGTGTFSLSADSTELGWLWDSGTGLAVTVPDDQVIFEICFTPIGTVGSFTNVSFVDVPGRPISIEDANGVLKHVVDNGKVTVCETKTTLKLYTRDTSAIENSEFCVPIYVDDFTCIESFQYAVKFDSTKLRFKRIDNIILKNLLTSLVIKTNDTINILWDNGTFGPQTLGKGTPMFDICFDVIVPCTSTTKLNMLPLMGNLEFTSDCVDPEPQIIIGDGLITVKCKPADTPMAIVILGKTDISCFGVCDGTASANVTGGSKSYKYAWIDQINGNGTTVVSTVKDPTNLCAGKYRLKVTDMVSNTMVTSSEVTIVDATPITIQATVTHETDPPKNNGVINITPSGGMPSYTFKWFRVGNNTVLMTTEDLGPRACGNYAVSVTDSKGCVNVDTFRINCPVSKLIAKIVKIDSSKCFGDCLGKLRVDTEGGAIPYKYKWSVPNETSITIDSLCAGTYSVTVTDANDSVSVATFILTEPTKISISVTSITPDCGTGNGGAAVSVTNGTPSYTYAWKNSSNVTVSTAIPLVNVPKGTYVLCVTDANKCVQCTEIIIPMCTDTSKITVNVTVDKNISCSGICDGKLIASVIGGTQPFIYKWSHNANLNSNIADQLCSGIYTVTVTDAGGKTNTGRATITATNAIQITVKRLSCATKRTAADGKYEAIVSGGTKPYQYEWCNGATTASVSDLVSGGCSVKVTDANGCSDTETFTVCDDEVPPADCFSGRLAISPNGDNYNENFVISCIEKYNNTLNIYDRWGKLVYAAVDYLNTWNGVNAAGEPLNEGTYMWVLVIKEAGKNDVYYKGTVTIVR